LHVLTIVKRSGGGDSYFSPFNHHRSVNSRRDHAYCHFIDTTAAHDGRGPRAFFVFQWKKKERIGDRVRKGVSLIKAAGFGGPS
jgi:hypothetical protein